MSSGRRLRGVAVGYRQGPGQETRAGGAGEPRGGQAGLDASAARASCARSPAWAGVTSGGQGDRSRAFLNGVFYDGVDLRHFKRWSRDPSVEVRIALELGEPPEFDGVLCTDCGNRFRTEFDHVEPHVAQGPSLPRQPQTELLPLPPG